MNDLVSAGTGALLIPTINIPVGDERGPFMRTAHTAHGLEAVLEQYTRWVILPERLTTPATAGLPILVRRCRELTGWSIRELASVLGTSHTTIRMFETEGRVTARSRDPASRVRPLLGVLSRLSRVAGHPERLGLALATSLDTGERPIDLLNQQQWARAFTVALDVLRGPRPDMLVPQDDWDAPLATREMC
jgi:transcriptional regulator with XRE-family HTH domain